MGGYNQSGEEIADSFERWFTEQSIEGNIHAAAMAEAYNLLSEKYGWEDRLQEESAGISQTKPENDAKDGEDEYGDAIAVSLFVGMIGVLEAENGKKITDVDKINHIIPLMNEACKIYKSMEDVDEKS